MSIATSLQRSSVAVTVAAILMLVLPGAANALFRTTSFGSDAWDLRFETISQAHVYVRDRYVVEEQGQGEYVGEQLYATNNYRGEYVSKTCFKYTDATEEYDAESCSGSSVYYRTGIILPDLDNLSETPFLDRDAGLPSTSMCVGNPIHLGTGNKYQFENDYLSGGTDPLAFSRYYNSLDGSPKMGGWRHLYQRSVVLEPESLGENLVVLERHDGQSLAFIAINGEWLATWATDDQLLKTASGWKYRSSLGVEEDYDDQGNLLKISFPSGNHITLEYQAGRLSAVKDRFGRALNFHYTGDQLTSVTDPGGRQIQYQYDANGLLASVTYQDGRTKHYLYDDPQAPGLLSGIIDEKGNRYATWAYDAERRAVLSEHAGGADRTEVSYNSDGTVSVTNALGHVQTYSFRRYNGKLKADVVEGAPCSGFPGGTETRSYDENGMLAEIQDAAGQSRSFAYNNRGLATTVVTRTGSRIETQWHHEFSLPVKISEPERVTEFAYDDQLRVTQKTVRDQYSRTVRTWSYTYHPEGHNGAGLIAAIDGPRTDVNDTTQFSYDAEGNLVKTVNALGHEQHWGKYDAHGRPSEYIDANGNVWEMTYDNRGRLIKETGPRGEKTYQYDERGLLVSVTTPNGITVTRTYDDAHRLISINDGLNNQQRWTLDALGNATLEQLQSASGSVHWLYHQTFNEIGWKTAITDAYGNETALGYDVVANLIQETDPTGDQYQYQYDGFHKRTLVRDPLGKTIGYRYHDTGQIYTVTDPRTRRTSYQYNAHGELTELRSPDTGLTRFSYDDAGNLSTRTDAKGTVISYTYDAVNRPVLVSSSVASEPDIQYGYDDPASEYGIGRLTSVDDGNGIRTFDYTAEGWIAAETWNIAGRELTTRYEYDGAGQLSKTTYPSGRVVTFTRNAAGNISSISTTFGGITTSVASQIERAPWGPVMAMLHGNGLEETRTLDLNYRTTAISVPGVHSLSYTYTADSNIANINDLDTPSLSQQLAYDAVNRLIGAEGSYGLLDFTYDATGNRTSITTDSGTEAYEIRYSNNWLMKAGAESNSYDANGNTVDRGGDVFTYDSFNRLVGASVGSNTALYTYNHLDQRVTKTLNGHTRLLVYDRSGNLIAEMDSATGSVLAEYIWLDGTPLAFVQSGQTYHVHVDHLGTPKALTDGSGQVVWKADYSPFGKATMTSQGPTFNLRFPGQYYDAETGLHYNWRRYYDPNTGRYITSDPIGLAGGINTYSYALSNPIGNADPTGEFVPLLIGAYAAVEFALSAWDAYDTYQTIISDCTSTGEKWTSGGLFAAGVLLPGNYGWVDNAAGTVKKYEVGLFNDLVARSARGDRLDIHHVAQKHPAGQVISGYDPRTAPSMAVPQREHRRIPTIRGSYDQSPRDLLAKDVRDLRNYTNAPNEAIKKLIQLNKAMYPDAYRK